MPGAVTIGGLVINLSANTGQLKSDLADASASIKTSSQTMTNAWAGVAAESDNATSAGERLVRQLKDEIATFGMSSQELQQYKANMNGVGSEVATLIGRLNNLKDAQAGLSVETAALAAAEASATTRIRDMVAASLAEMGAVNEAAAATRGFTVAATESVGVTRNWSEAQRLQALNMAGVAASMKAAQVGTAGLSIETQKILARYDPLGVKLRSLQSDLAILRKEMGDSVDPAAMKAFQGLEGEIDKTSKLMAKAGVDGFGAMSDGASKSGFATASVSRELMVLGHEVIAGNFSRIPGSLMVLTSRVGGLSAMVSELAGGFGLIAAGALMVAGPIVLAGAAAIQGKNDFIAMNTAIGLTSNYAGQSIDSINELAMRLGAAGQITTGAAKQMVTSFVASGQIGGQALEKIALMAGNYAQATGESVEEITPKLIQLFSDPKQGADELNKSMHFLTAANIDYIAELENTGQHQQAQLLLAQALSGHLAIQARELSGLTKWWHDLTAGMSAFWDVAKQHMSGTATPYQAQLQAAQAALDELQSTPNLFGGDKELDKKIATQKAYIASLIAGHKTEQEAKKAADDAASQEADRQKAITTELNQGQLHQIDLLKQKRALLDGAGDSSAVQQRRLEIDNQIAAIERSMGAEGRQITQQQLTDSEQLALLKLKGQQQDAENARKLGQVDQLGYDLRTARIALQENEVKQDFEQRMTNISGLTAVERQAHVGKLAMLKEEHDQIEKNGAATYDEDDKKAFDAMMKGITDAGDAQVKSLDDQIAKQKEHNAEIGKTKEQIELARQAQADAAAADMKREADAIDALLNQADLQGVLIGKDRELYAARLAYLNINIGKEQQLADLRATGSSNEAMAKASADLDKYLDPTKAEKFGNSLKGSLGNAAKAMVDLGNVAQKFGAQQAANDKARTEAQKLLTGNDAERAKGLVDLEKVNRKNTQEQLASYGDLAGAAASFFGSHSRGYQALSVVSQAFHAAELAMTLAEQGPKAIAAILNQASAGDPYTAFGRMAAMAAIVAGLGVAIGGIGGGMDTTAQDRQAAQGTGTVLGDSTAKSDSIKKSIDLTAANSSTQINYLSGLLTTLKSIETDIGNFAAELVKTTDVANPNVSLNTNNGLGKTVASVGVVAGAEVVGGMIGSAILPGIGTVIGAALGDVAGFIISKIPVIGNLLGKVGNSIFGGNQSLQDSGLTIGKDTLGNIDTSGAKAMTYADVTTSGGWFSSDKHSTQTTGLTADANNQITTIIRSLGSSIKQAGTLLGENGDAFEAKLNSFVVDIGKVSLKGLSAEDQQKAIEAVFSKLGDQMAQAAIPDLTQFQAVGEGYLQTLVRVASDYAKVDASLQSINVTFGKTGVASIGARENLISLLGGIDDFQSKTADYAQNFLTKAQQLAPVQAFVTSQLQAIGQGWIKTRADFASAITTLSGQLDNPGMQQIYASLMNLEGAFAAVTPAIEDTTKSLQDIADERKDLQGQLDQLTMTQAQLLEKQRDALDDSNKALFDQVQAAQKAKDASDAAKASLNSFLDRMKSFAVTAAGLNNSLLLGDLTTLNPEQQLAEARRQYQQVNQAAQGGDATAQGQLQAIEQTFLKLSQQVNGGDAAYSSDLAMVMHNNDQLASLASQQVNVAQAQLDALNGIASSVTSIQGIVVRTISATTGGQIRPTADPIPRRATGAAQVRATTAAPVDYSTMGTSDKTSLVQEIKALRTSHEAMLTELKGLRAEALTRTGNEIGAAAAIGEKIADAVEDVRDTVKSIKKPETVIA
jgi:hypothetical protein